MNNDDEQEAMRRIENHFNKHKEPSAIIANKFLQDEIAKLREEVTALRMGWDECSREKEELTRKLAEQQAATTSAVYGAAKLAACLFDYHDTCPECGNIKGHMPNCRKVYAKNFNGPQDTFTAYAAAFPTESGVEELNTLLAKAREEGRKEAVPEGWQVVPKEVVDFWSFCKSSFVPFTSQHEQLMISLRKANAAMLAAAPKPEKKP